MKWQWLKIRVPMDPHCWSKLARGSKHIKKKMQNRYDTTRTKNGREQEAKQSHHRDTAPAAGASATSRASTKHSTKNQPFSKAKSWPEASPPLELPASMKFALLRLKSENSSVTHFSNLLAE
jgi:hypothetical protein